MNIGTCGGLFNYAQEIFGVGNVVLEGLCHMIPKNCLYKVQMHEKALYGGIGYGEVGSLFIYET